MSIISYLRKVFTFSSSEDDTNENKQDDVVDRVIIQEFMPGDIMTTDPGASYFTGNPNIEVRTHELRTEEHIFCFIVHPSNEYTRYMQVYAYSPSCNNGFFYYVSSVEIAEFMR